MKQSNQPMFPYAKDLTQGNGMRALIAIFTLLGVTVGSVLQANNNNEPSQALIEITFESSGIMVTDVTEGETIDIKVKRNVTTGTPQVTTNQSPSGKFLVTGDGEFDAGEDTVTYQLTAIDNSFYEGADTTVAITVSATGYASTSKEISIKDNDVQTLTLTPSTQDMSEGASNASLTVSRNTTTTSSLDVTISSSLPNELGGTDFIVTIPQGQSDYPVTVDSFPDNLDESDETVTITASAPTFTSGQATVVILDDDDTPVISSSLPLTPTVEENQAFSVTFDVDDADDPDPTVTITGIDSGQFNLTENANDWTLSLIAPQDFEVPLDSDSNNTYQVTINATDGTNIATPKNVVLTVTPVNEAPYFTNLSYNHPENSVGPIGLSATDDDAGQNTFNYELGSVLSGEDTGLFQIVSNQLQFISAQDYENPQQQGGVANAYTVRVIVKDAALASTESLLTVNVYDVNEIPNLTLNPLTTTESENSTTPIDVATLSVDDAIGTHVYSVDNGTYFEVVGNTLRVKSGATLDYESTPTLNVVVTVDDTTIGTSSDDTANYTLSLDDVNEAPGTISSGGTLSVDLNAGADTAIGTFSVIDPDNADGQNLQTHTFALTDDPSGLFRIDTDGKTLETSTLLSPPKATSYTIKVQATDNGTPNLSSTEQSFTITINNDPPSFSQTTYNHPENDTSSIQLVASDPEGESPVFTLTGGVDQSDFTLTSGGQLSFNTTPDFENPHDDDQNNSYLVQVQLSDSNNTVSPTSITINVTPVNEAPYFTSTTYNHPENSVGPILLNADDSDAGDSFANLSFTIGSILAGEDSGAFEIVNNQLHFKSAPDYENPTQQGAMANQYTVRMIVTDDEPGTPASSAETLLSVNVTGQPEPPSISYSGAQSSPEDQVFSASNSVSVSDPEDPPSSLTVTGSSSNQSIVQDQGVVVQGTGSLRTLQISPVQDANGTVTIYLNVSDGVHSPVQTTFPFTVNAVNDPPEFVTAPVLPDHNENELFVATVAATDIEGSSLTFSKVNSYDGAQFNVSSTGDISFITAPDFEVPPPTNLDRYFDIEVAVTDSVDSVTRVFSFGLADVNESPTIQTGQSQSIPENTTAVVTIAATDPENDSLTYSISSGADSAKFSLDSSLGALSFVDAPDYEFPTDQDTNNQYEVVVAVSDGTNPDVTQAISVTVTDDGAGVEPTIDPISNYSYPQGTRFVGNGIVLVDDPDSAVDSLVVTGTSSDQNIVADASISVLGLGNARDLRMDAVPNGYGDTIITVTVTDGTYSAQTAFAYTVEPTGTPPADSDGDGCNDPDEDVNGNGVYDPEDPSDWLSKDTDLDGIDDKTEMVNGLDPKNPDSDGDGVNDNFELGNSIPVPTDDAYTALQGQQLTLSVLLNDSTLPDAAETLTITAVGTPSQGGTASINANSDALTYTAPASYVGDETFTYTVTDGRGAWVSATVTVSIDLANYLPTMTDIADIVMPANVSFNPYVTTVSDPDDPVTALLLSDGVDNATVFPNGAVELSGALADRNVTLTPANGQFGTAQLTLTLSDGTDQVSQNVAIQVGPHGLPPADTDGDGIPDYLEDDSGDGQYLAADDRSHWSNVDTDGDLLSDYEELQQGTDPENADNSQLPTNGFILFNEFE